MELCLVVPANLHPYLSDRSYLAPLAPEFDQVWRFLAIFFLLLNILSPFPGQKGLFLSMTVPATFVLMFVIVCLILAFSFAHWLAYHNTVDKGKLFQERFEQF